MSAPATAPRSSGLDLCATGRVPPSGRDGIAATTAVRPASRRTLRGPAGCGRSVKRSTALLTVLLLLVQLWHPAAGGADEAELQAARQEAREASAAFSATETRLAELEAGLARTAASIDATRAAYDALRAAVAEQAVQQYVRAGSGSAPLVSDDINVQARASALSRAARGEATSRADELGGAKARLERQEADLARQQREAQQAREVQRERQGDLYARLAELEAIEARRQESERQAEQARRQAEAAAAAAAYQAAVGRGGGSGSGSAPAPPRPIVPVNWLCPITGAYAFSDTWGEARSNGRSHRGTDMFADYGTPLVAVVSGEAVNYGWSDAGGYDVFLLGDDGNRYYYAHLEGPPNEGRMRQGDVVGYVGDSGNATGTPHLHFEIHPGGSGWTNPYPTLAIYC